MRLTDGRFFLAGFVVAIGLLRASCSYTPPSACPSIRTPQGIRCALGFAPKAKKTKSDLKMVLDEKGGLRIQHGFTCGSADDGATRSTLGSKFEERVPLPANYDATVFLNGWRTQYLSKDHHMLGLAVLLSKIEINARNQLTWTAAGVIGDKNGDDSYEWCYHFTVLAWPKGNANLDLSVTHDSKDHDLFFLAPKDSPFGALRAFTGSFANAKATKARTPLLTGFGMAWSDDDHHLLQLGFDTGKPFLKDDTLQWGMNTILKDNARSRAYTAAAGVSILGGNSVGLFQPSGSDPKLWNNLRLKVRDPKDTPGANLGHNIHVFPTKVTGVPFDYAIPMLTGWDVGDAFSDRHVRAIEASITGFRFAKDPATKKLTLDYEIQGVFQDKDTIPADKVDFEVTILGIRKPQLVARIPADGLPILELAPGGTVSPPDPVTCNGKAATLVGTGGADELNGTGVADVIVGLGGNDVIRGRGGDDSLCGNEGDDVLEGGLGSDFCDGGLGTNTTAGCEK